MAVLERRMVPTTNMSDIGSAHANRRALVPTPRDMFLVMPTPIWPSEASSPRTLRSPLSIAVDPNDSSRNGDDGSQSASRMSRLGPVGHLQETGWRCLGHLSLSWVMKGRPRLNSYTT
jgi:hypothetical protein